MRRVALVGVWHFLVGAQGAIGSSMASQLTDALLLEAREVFEVARDVCVAARGREGARHVHEDAGALTVGSGGEDWM